MIAGAQRSFPCVCNRHAARRSPPTADPSTISTDGATGAASGSANTAGASPITVLSCAPGRAPIQGRPTAPPNHTQTPAVPPARPDAPDPDVLRKYLAAQDWVNKANGVEAGTAGDSEKWLYRLLTDKEVEKRRGSDFLFMADGAAQLHP